MREDLIAIVSLVIGLFLGCIFYSFFYSPEEQEYGDNMEILLGAVQDGAQPTEDGVYIIPFSEEKTLLAIPDKDKGAHAYTFSLVKNDEANKNLVVITKEGSKIIPF